MTRNVRSKTEIKIVRTEDQEQTRFVTWLAKQGLIFYAIPNGGYRNLIEAMKLKRTGVQPGVPDICIPIPAGIYHGLYVELKREKGGKVSENQLFWLTQLRDKGYCADVAYGFDQAREIVLRYLSLTCPAA